MSLDPEYKEMVRNWFKFIKQNDIKSPDKDDVRRFLHSVNYESPSIEQALNMPEREFEVEPESPTKQNAQTNEPENDEPENDEPSGATVPGELDSQEPERKIGDDAITPEILDFHDMDNDQRDLYKEFIGIIKVLNDKQRTMLANEIKRYANDAPNS